MKRKISTDEEKLLKPLHLQGLGVIPRGTPMNILKVTTRTVQVEVRDGLTATVGKSYFYKGGKNVAKRKKTLAQQYEAQLERIAEALIKMQQRGYTVVGDFQKTTPKKVTKKMVDDLRAINVKSLARLSDKSYTINIGHKKQLVQKVRDSKKIDYRKVPESKRPPKPLPPIKRPPVGGPPPDEGEMIWRRIQRIFNTPYNTGLNIAPWQYAEHIADIRSLLYQTVAQIGKKDVIHRFATAGEVAVEAVEGYVFSSDSEPAHMMSWYTFVEILTAGDVPDEVNEKLTELSDWSESI